MKHNGANPIPRSAAITARDLAIGYRGKVIISGIDFAIDRGQSLALVGMNGSGKTTLLKTLAGLLPSISGYFSVLGLEQREMPGKIAYLSQFHSTGFILPLRVIDVVRMGRFAGKGLLGQMTTEDQDFVDQAMRRMGISSLANKPLQDLSGGQQQRVYLAQMLSSRAEVFLLDEPQAGLDSAGKALYRQAFAEELQRGACVILATHDVQEALWCSQAMLLAGRVVAIGVGKEIITQETLFETFGIPISPDQDFAIISLEHRQGS